MISPAFLALAGFATVALPKSNFVAVCSPQLLNQDYQLTGLIDEYDGRWIVSVALSKNAQHEAFEEEEALQAFSKLFDTRILDLDVPRLQAKILGKNGAPVRVFTQVPGRKLNINALEESEALTDSYARTLGRIHRLNPKEIGLPQLPVLLAEEVRSRTLSQLQLGLGTGFIPPILVRRWQDALANTHLWNFAPALARPNSEEEDFSVSSAKVLALNSLKSLEYSDPAFDFTWLVAQASDRLLSKVFDIYCEELGREVDPELFTRAQFYGELKLLQWLLHALRSHDSKAINQAKELLDALANQVGEGLENPLLGDEEPEPAGENALTEPDAKGEAAEQDTKATRTSPISAAGQEEPEPNEDETQAFPRPSA